MNRSKTQTRNRLFQRTNLPASTTTTTTASTIGNNPIDSPTRSKNIRQNSRSISKNRQPRIIEPISNDNNDKDDNWICPVAVVLRQAGYDVPLRPTKSWLERDRQKQALLSAKKQISAKKI